MFDLSKSKLSFEDPRIIFNKLGEDFGIHKDVIPHMVVVCQMQSLDDFRFCFANNGDVANMVARVRPSSYPTRKTTWIKDWPFPEYDKPGTGLNENCVSMIEEQRKLMLQISTNLCQLRI